MDHARSHTKEDLPVLVRGLWSVVYLLIPTILPMPPTLYIHMSVILDSHSLHKHTFLHKESRVIVMRVLVIFVCLIFLSSVYGFVHKGKYILTRGVSQRGIHAAATLHMMSDDADELLYKPVSSQGERGILYGYMPSSL